MLKIKNPSRISVPKRCKFDVNNNFIPTAESNAQPAGFKPLIAPFMFLFVRNLSITLKTIVTMIYDGKIIAVVATKEPKIPAVVKPANVATSPRLVQGLWMKLQAYRLIVLHYTNEICLQYRTKMVKSHNLLQKRTLQRGKTVKIIEKEVLAFFIPLIIF